MDEIETAVPGETGEPIAEPQATFGAEPVIDSQETPATNEETPPQREAWDKILESYKDDEDHKRWRERERKVDLIAGQKREAGQRNQILTAEAHVFNSVKEMNESLKTAIDDGVLDGKFVQKLIQEHAPALQQYAGVMGQGVTRIAEDAVLTNVKLAMQLAANHPEVKADGILDRYLERFEDEYRYDENRGQEAFNDFISDIVRAARKDAEEKGYQRGLKASGQVATETRKAEQRKGQGPNTETGSTAGGSMTYEKYLALPPEEFGKLPESVHRAMHAEGAKRQTQRT